MSTSQENDRPQIEIASDEDWKARVKEEDARRDAEARVSEASTYTESTDDDSELDDEALKNLPEPTMATLFQMLSTQAILAMGLMPGLNGKTTVKLPLARHFIDLLSLLQSKTKGNLTGNEDRLLEATLHELRMAYVKVSDIKSKEATSAN